MVAMVAQNTWKMFFTCGQASSAPPGIKDGPYLAPSSPPLTPQPMYSIPFSASDLQRR